MQLLYTGTTGQASTRPLQMENDVGRCGTCGRCTGEAFHGGRMGGERPDQQEHPLDLTGLFNIAMGRNMAPSSEALAAKAEVNALDRSELDRVVQKVVNGRARAKGRIFPRETRVSVEPLVCGSYPPV